MDWQDLMKFSTSWTTGRNRPAAYISNPTLGDLIIIGPSHDSIAKYIAEHPEEGVVGPPDMSSVEQIVLDYDGVAFDEGGGRLTMI